MRNRSYTSRVQAPISLAVTPLQLALVREIRSLHRHLGQPPTARQVAIAADVAFPVACAELKSLARVGVVEWGKTIRVLREPDGLFFWAQNTEPPFSSVTPRGCVPEADRYGVTR